MTPEAQRIAIAEACGWSECSRYTGLVGFHGKRPGTPLGCLSKVPDYLDDLDAIDEAMTDLRQRDRHSFLCELERVVGFQGGPGGWDMDAESVWAICHATAAQRAEALLRTLNLWDDSK